MNRLGLLSLLNIVDCDCPDCLWQKCHDIADAVESGNAVFGADDDQVIALHATRDGVRLMRSYPLMGDGAA
jgi:hypothetical protein